MSAKYYEDFSQLCRACLTKIDSNIRSADILQTTPGVELVYNFLNVSTSAPPNKFCPNCIMKILIIVEFRKQCLDTWNQIQAKVEKMHGSSETKHESKPENRLMSVRINKASACNERVEIKTEKEESEQSNLFFLDSYPLKEDNDIKSKKSNVSDGSIKSEKGDTESSDDNETIEEKNDDFDYDDNNSDSSDERETNEKVATKKENTESMSTNDSFLVLYNNLTNPLNDKMMVPCNECTTAPSKGSSNKQTSKEKVIYSCDQCPKKCDSEMLLARHFLRFHRVVACELCNKKCKNRIAYYKHKRVHNQDPRYCPVCNKTFASAVTLRIHTESVHGHIEMQTCTMCNKQVKHLKNHIKYAHENRNVQCDICKKTYRSKQYLAIHNRAVHQNITELCTICGQSFKSLSEHMSNIHSDERPYKCQYCPKSYKRPTHAKKHERAVHLKLRPHKCEYKDCAWAFATREQLKNHTLTHTNERPFVCNICSSAFNQKVTLTQHMKLLHGTGLK